MATSHPLSTLESLVTLINPTFLPPPSSGAVQLRTLDQRALVEALAAADVLSPDAATFMAAYEQPGAIMPIDVDEEDEEAWLWPFDVHAIAWLTKPWTGRKSAKPVRYGWRIMSESEPGAQARMTVFTIYGYLYVRLMVTPGSRKDPLVAEIKRFILRNLAHDKIKGLEASPTLTAGWSKADVKKYFNVHSPRKLRCRDIRGWLQSASPTEDEPLQRTYPTALHRVAEAARAWSMNTGRDERAAWALSTAVEFALTAPPPPRRPLPPPSLSPPNVDFVFDDTDDDDDDDDDDTTSISSGGSLYITPHLPRIPDDGDDDDAPAKKRQRRE